jgi:hypothetical protein
MNDIVAFFDRAAKRTGFHREYYVEKNLPTLTSNVVVLPLFGDIRTTFVMSSLVLKRIKDKNPGKYFVVASWPGQRGLFPYMDEYWSISDSSLIKTLASNANNLYNGAELMLEITRSFIEVFSSVWTFKDIQPYYNNGFGQRFWDEFKDVRRFLPEVPAENLLRNDFRTQVERRPGKKVLVFPVRKMRSWQRGKLDYLPLSKEFWLHLVNRMLNDGFDPIIYQNGFTYDLSPDLADKCVYLAYQNIQDVLCAMAYIGCVLDVFSGISRFAISARTPFVCVDERARFVNQKEYEVDDLCCDFLPRQYIFGFSTMLLTGTPHEWDMSLVDNIMNRLHEFIPTLNQRSWGSSGQEEVAVAYDKVRRREERRMGITFIGMSKEECQGVTNG